MRRTLKGFAGSVALLLALAFAGRAHAAVCGDLNGNGSRSTADVVLLFRAVLENPDPSPLCGGSGAGDCGDINGAWPATAPSSRTKSSRCWRRSKR